MPRSHQVGPRRHGITLVEVLVVIVLMGMLAAMLTPALGRARERGRRTACTRNQYQIAFAMVRFDEDNGHLPGWLNTAPGSLTAPCSWPVVLLPFLGRQDVFDAWNGPAAAPQIEQFICPSVTVTKHATSGTPPTPLHYAGNAGAVDSDVWPSLPARPVILINKREDGVFLNLVHTPSQARPDLPSLPDVIQPTSLADIEGADGTSMTLAVAEKATRRHLPHAWNFAQAESLRLFDVGASFPPVFGVPGPPTTSPSHPVINNLLGTAPASDHPEGVVVAFCDGHTGFLSDALDPWVYAQLITPYSRWVGGEYKWNSRHIKPWLLKNNGPYVLDVRDFK